jgi:molybdopterin converting factor subunit 1
MKINVLYFARLRETFGLGGETLELPEGSSVEELISELRARGGDWDGQLAPERAFRIAVDQEVVGLNTPLHEGAEVAIFPPVTGG